MGEFSITHLLILLFILIVGGLQWFLIVKLIKFVIKKLKEK